MRHFNHLNHSYENAVFVEVLNGTEETVVEPVWRWGPHLEMVVLHYRLQPYLRHWLEERAEESQ